MEYLDNHAAARTLELALAAGVRARKLAEAAADTRKLEEAKEAAADRMARYDALTPFERAQAREGI